ncbi:MAG: ABC transporter permease [Trueperaceae bacterium]|nr:ABC transporter permease [Trueperaceae bacterium]
MSTQSIDRRKGRDEVSSFQKWLRNNRRVLTSAAFLVVMLIAFTLANPSVFTQFKTYRAVMIALPISIFLVVPLVFVVTAGEIDLAFPAIVGMASYGFASIIDVGGNPLLALIAALAIGLLLGFVNGIFVVQFGLSALIATLGMNFLLRGLINIGAEGFSIALPEIRGTLFHTLLTGTTFGIPNQMFWALGFAIIGFLLYNFHKFGVHVHCVGDHPGSAQEMGINVKRTRIMVFVFSGLGAAFAGVFSVMINFVWWPTTGDGLLLPVLAGIFVGGTPAWGGIGTVLGGVFGVSIVSFIETGVIAAGLTGFFTQFFYGIIIISSLIGHRLNGERVR